MSFAKQLGSQAALFLTFSTFPGCYCCYFRSPKRKKHENSVPLQSRVLRYSPKHPDSWKTACVYLQASKYALGQRVKSVLSVSGETQLTQMGSPSLSGSSTSGERGLGDTGVSREVIQECVQGSGRCHKTNGRSARGIYKLTTEDE